MLCMQCFRVQNIIALFQTINGKSTKFLNIVGWSLSIEMVIKFMCQLFLEMSFNNVASTCCVRRIERTNASPVLKRYQHRRQNDERQPLTCGRVYLDAANSVELLHRYSDDMDHWLVYWWWFCLLKAITRYDLFIFIVGCSLPMIAHGVCPGRCC